MTGCLVGSKGKVELLAFTLLCIYILISTYTKSIHALLLLQFVNFKDFCG